MANEEILQAGARGVAQPAAMPAELVATAQQGGMAWRRLGLRLRSITPAALLRFAIVVAFLGAAIWLIGRAGLALLPFWGGLVLAYVTLPFVNWLDRFMPRILAITLLLLLELLILALIVAVIAPIFVQEIIAVVESLPTWQRVQAWWFETEAYLKTLPMVSQDFLDGWLRNVYNNARTNFSAYLLRFVSVSVVTAVEATRLASFLISFLIIPTWLVSVLNDQRQVRRGLDGAMPSAVRPDFWAVVRILDRAFNAFVRMRLVVATLIGIFFYLSLVYLPPFNTANLPFPLALALIAGLFNLIPIVGPIVGLLPVTLLALSVSWQIAVSVAVIYILVVVLVNLLVGRWLEGRAIDIHPAVLAPIIIIGSTFGFLGAVLAGPIAVVARDLVRYSYGRLSDPPQPAGLIPGETRASSPVRLPGRVVMARGPRRLTTERDSALNS
ncbi:MAG: AI-2E family transporter [Caldilineaceae bacterium]